MLQVASWNVNSLRMRLEQVLTWLQVNSVDVLCLQELKMSDVDFPVQAFTEIGYHVQFFGQKAYNGVAIISKKPAQVVQKGIPDFIDDQSRYIAIDYPYQDSIMRIVNVYVPNGQSLTSDKFVYKRLWFQALTKNIQQLISTYRHVVLVGDFNITPSDLDVHDTQKWQHDIHCSDIERLWLHTLMAKGLYDSYRQLHPKTAQFSWWDYRNNAYQSGHGLRIDLVLCSRVLCQSVQKSWVDEAPRQLIKPSDHTPVITTFAK